MIIYRIRGNGHEPEEIDTDNKDSEFYAKKDVQDLPSESVSLFSKLKALFKRNDL